MAEYRVPDFTLEQRINAALEMIVPWPKREWGRVTELACQHGVSRTILYEIRDRALQALVEVLSPHDAGRPAQTTTLTVDKNLIERTIAVLPMLIGTVRGIPWPGQAARAGADSERQALGGLHQPNAHSGWRTGYGLQR